jgi:1-acyl-sn-glycerol-3-phosphate acyltransferase
MAGLVIGALFILPFLLFSATSGPAGRQVRQEGADPLREEPGDRHHGAGRLGLCATNVPVLLACTFLMGLHSTLFGPVKFAYLPQVLNERELTGGNGMVEMGTFVAILLGNVAGGLLVAMPEIGAQHVAIACVLALGRGGGGAVHPPVRRPPTRADHQLEPGHRNLAQPQAGARQRGGVPLAAGHQLDVVLRRGVPEPVPSFAKEVLHGNEQVASLLLVVFSIGIGTGSLLCEVLSRRHVEIGLVPLGAIGMSVLRSTCTSPRAACRRRCMGAGRLSGAAGPLARDGRPGAAEPVCRPVQRADVRADPAAQPAHAPRPHHRGQQHPERAVHDRQLGDRRRAAAQAGFTIPQIFLFTGLANAVVAFYIFLLVPEYLLRFVAWVLSRFVYRFKVQGDEHIPTEGAAMLVCNHVSFVDAVLLMAASPRPIRFIMDHRIFKVPVLGWLFKLAKAIPIAPRSEDPPPTRPPSRRRAGAARGRPAGIFPEGGITRDGSCRVQGRHHEDPGARQADGLTVPVIPMALTNLWGSFFSRVEQGGGHGAAVSARLFSRVGLNVGCSA